MKSIFGEDMARFSRDELTAEQMRYLAGFYVTVPDTEAQRRVLSPVEIRASEAERINDPAKEVLEHAQVEIINTDNSSS